mmetsp:Transcript_1935/g.4033  ORF Transcript_1935/g.4033 Transcript_1935/m.4033 type:complete len:351 (-) Transcript_1935:179-1231(-)
MGGNEIMEGVERGWHFKDEGDCLLCPQLGLSFLLFLLVLLLGHPRVLALLIRFGGTILPRSYILGNHSFFHIAIVICYIIHHLPVIIFPNRRDGAIVPIFFAGVLFRGAIISLDGHSHLQFDGRCIIIIVVFRRGGGGFIVRVAQVVLLAGCPFLVRAIVFGTAATVIIAIVSAAIIIIITIASCFFVSNLTNHIAMFIHIHEPVSRKPHLILIFLLVLRITHLLRIGMIPLHLLLLFILILVLSSFLFVGRFIIIVRNIRKLILAQKVPLHPRHPFRFQLVQPLRLVLGDFLGSFGTIRGSYLAFEEILLHFLVPRVHFLVGLALRAFATGFAALDAFLFLVAELEELG